MPSHPDRVRRNYHTTTLVEYEDRARMELVVTVRVTKLEIATWMNRHEMRNGMLRLVAKAIDAAK